MTRDRSLFTFVQGVQKSNGGKQTCWLDVNSNLRKKNAMLASVTFVRRSVRFGAPDGTTRFLSETDACIADRVWQIRAHRNPLHYSMANVLIHYVRSRNFKETDPTAEH